MGRRLNGWESLRKKWDRVQSGLQWRTFYWNNRKFHRRIVGNLESAVRDVDVVYVHSNAYLASELARVRPTVLRLPGPLGPDLSSVLQSIHAVCANGDALRLIRSFLGHHARELPVGLDQELFSPGSTSERSSLNWSANDKVVGYVGRLSHIKGVDVLAEGFRKLAAVRDDARLLVIGTGEEETNLHASLKAEIASGRVHFAGDVSHERLPA